MISRYAETYTAWQRDPLNFWAEAAKEIDWIQAPQNIFDAKAGGCGRWFPDATCNTCWNALDRHVVAGQGHELRVEIFLNFPNWTSLSQWRLRPKALISLTPVMISEPRGRLKPFKKR